MILSSTWSRTASVGNLESLRTRSLRAVVRPASVGIPSQRLPRLISHATPPLVHPTALVDPTAVLAASAQIGPYCIISSGVELGEGVVLGSHVHLGASDPLIHTMEPTQIRIGTGVRIGNNTVLSGKITVGPDAKLSHFVAISGPARIGDRTEIHSGTVIGSAGQFPGRHRHDGEVSIGIDVVIREQCCITKPVLTDTTCVGDGSYLMARTQVDHDCILGKGVKTAAGVTFGGSVRIDSYAYLGMNAVVHQGVRVGAGTMIGMNGVVMRHVPPYATLVGRRFTKLNRRGLVLRGATDADIAAIERRYRNSSEAATGETGEPWLNAIDQFYREIGDGAVSDPEFASR